MKRARILFVDDQKSARDLFERLLAADRYEAVLAASVAQAEEEMSRRLPDVIITDLRMPEVDGLEGLKRFQRISAEVPVILITGFGSVETAVDAMKRGAFDYLRKPYEPAEIELVIERALRHRNLVCENERLRSEVTKKFSRNNIVFGSAAMTAVVNLAERVATAKVPVLIVGESGTGKDLIARLIHYSGRSVGTPFVSLNCSAIPEHLLESELFGYAKGAFSEAKASRTGFFEKANGGTLFLDEIGDMSPNIQPKLLRVLQNGEFYPIGSRQLVRTDARLVCASNQNLPALIESGGFRQDLYFRINTVCITLPPLRENPEEIPLLVEHFLNKHSEPSPTLARRVSADAMRLLLEYSWPGNVRELEHAIERATLVCDTHEINPVDLPPEIRAGASAAP